MDPVGTAGAIPLHLPQNAPANSQTDVYGYLIATAHPDGVVDFNFQKLTLDDLKRLNPDRPEQIVRWCMEQNKR